MEITHHVTVRRKRGFEFVAEFEDMPGKPSIRFDEPAPLGENHAPNAAAGTWERQLAIASRRV